MLDIELGSSSRTCDAMHRRGFLRLGSLAFGGLSLAGMLANQSFAAGPSNRKAVIQIWLAGGPSHIDMYDLKPSAPAEYRGEFRPIPTNVDGIEISEHLPHQAKVMDKLAIVRSAYHTNAGHGMGSQWMLTGWQPTIEVNNNIFPACGSVVARLKGANDAALPAYVNLPNMLGLGKSAYLGASFNPFAPDSDPNNDGFQVRNLKLPGRVDPERLENRRSLMARVDTIRRDLDTKSDMQELDKFYAQGLDMVTNDKTLKAFDIKAEDPALRERYGRNDLGQSCLLARRLVEAGTRVVEVVWPKVANSDNHSWDVHSGLSKRMKTQSAPMLDAGLSGLLADMDERGLLDETLVVAVGEFGRSPQRGLSTSGNNNSDDGRDHWPYCYTACVAGAGIKRGYIHGESDKTGSAPLRDPVHPGQLLATIYHAFGIDPHTIVLNHLNQPRELVQAEAVTSLFG
ncbi:MAG: DUF1501 domain-containing protein [Planctomycetaceae bacterium]|nr:DUF1501 domain-containing protein [Planctomycetaceae bacterium]